MNNEIIQNIIIKEILPNNNNYIKENIICSLKSNYIIIEYKNNTFKLKLKKNNLILINKIKHIKTFEINTPFKNIIEYIKNIP